MVTKSSYSNRMIIISTDIIGSGKNSISQKLSVVIGFFLDVNRNTPEIIALYIHNKTEHIWYQKCTASLEAGGTLRTSNIPIFLVNCGISINRIKRILKIFGE
jgi:hypothetical protein